MTPWTAQSGHAYRLCLLDTNVLSDCLKNAGGEGRRFLQRYVAQAHAPCFTFHTLIELRRRPDLFDAFLRMFSLIPWFLLKPWGQIELEETEAGSVSPLLNAFTALGSSTSYDAAEFFKAIERDPGIRTIEDDWRSDEEFGIQVLRHLAESFEPTGPAANSRDAERFLTFRPHTAAT